MMRFNFKHDGKPFGEGVVFDTGRVALDTPPGTVLYSSYLAFHACLGSHTGAEITWQGVNPGQQGEVTALMLAVPMYVVVQASATADGTTILFRARHGKSASVEIMDGGTLLNSHMQSTTRQAILAEVGSWFDPPVPQPADD